MGMTETRACGVGSPLYHDLMDRRAPSADPFDTHVFACILAARLADDGDLGLADEDLADLLARYFPGARLPLPPAADRLDPVLREEVADLRQLLLDHRSHGRREEAWLAALVARTCLGANHLWQDLGLRSRRDLSDLIQRHFARLKARNRGDMKWKKFFYKQLCDADPVLACKAPNCQVCSDYAVCFGPEE